MTALQYAKEHAEGWLTELEDLARIPSVSTDPAFSTHVRRAADWLVDRMGRAGLQNVELCPTAGHPVVYGEWLGAGPKAPTILLYAHYDVQPAIREDGWETDPFEPTRKDGRIYARGIGDDKIHSVMVIQVAEALLASGSGSPVNLKIVLEGEEEMGSRNFVPWVQSNKERLRADHCLICDGGMISAEQPSVIHALRGLIALEIGVTGPRADLHSGTYGGIVHNPAQVIAELVAGLHDDRGRVTVPGFYDHVAEVGQEERDVLNVRPFGESEFDESVGAPAAYGDEAYTLLERTTIRPTLEINGITGGYQGDGIKTVIPSRASAKITCRLVPNQRANSVFELIKSHVESIAPPTVDVTVTYQGGGEAVVVPSDGLLVKAFVEAISHSWEVKPIFSRMGGSIPIVPVVYEELGISSLPIGFNVQNAGFHGPNEFMVEEMFHKGLETLVRMLESVGSHSA